MTDSHAGAHGHQADHDYHMVEPSVWPVICALGAGGDNGGRHFGGHQPGYPVVYLQDRVALGG